METERPPGLPEKTRSALLRWLNPEKETHLSILYTGLDAHILFKEERFLAEDLQPLFETRWPETSLTDVLAELVEAGLLAKDADASFAVPPERRQPLVEGLEGYLLREPIPYPESISSFDELMYDFISYHEGEVQAASASAAPAAWGGQGFTGGDRLHLLLPRPHPLLLRAHPTAFILMLSELPDQGIETFVEQYIQRPALRHRLAIYDLEKAQKINLTRSAIFVHFERYLRRVHDRRIMPAPALTQGLVDSGILVLEKG